jgi:flagellar FliJ protein
MNSIALLKTLLQRAEADRDVAITVLRQAEGLQQQAELQAQQLQSYRSEYDQRWSAHFRQSGTTELLHCHRAFGSRLDHAISHQDMNTSALGNRVKQAREVLLAREQRVAAVRKLIERRQAELQKIAAHRDQRNTDEAAQRATASRIGHPMAAVHP